MDDNTFALLEKMYAEIQEGFKNVNSRFDKVETRLTKIETSMENDIRPKINLCLDELVNIKEKQTEHDKRFDTIDSQLEKHNVEISVIKTKRAK